MKNAIITAIFFITATLSAQKITNKVVDVACGECKFGMKGKDCELAVKIDGKTYFVDGTKIDQHGDAHAEDGFCNAVRQAEVTGTITGNRFKATAFKLLPYDPKAKK